MKSILFVEDDQAIRKLYGDLFTNLGYNVTLAENAPDALEEIENGDFFVMFFDINLPGMNGIELCGIVKEKYPSVPIYAVTGYADKYEMKQFQEAGFEEVISKPVDIKRLIAIVKTHAQ